MMLAAFTEAVTTVATVRLRHRLYLVCKCVLSVRTERICETWCMGLCTWKFFLSYLLTSLLTHSMEQSPSWEANRFSASEEIPRIL